MTSVNFSAGSGPSRPGVLKASILAPRTNGAKYYVAPLIAKSHKPQERRTQKGSAKSNPTSRRKVTTAAANTKPPLKADEPKVERVTILEF
jgi:hypothetical protein